MTTYTADILDTDGETFVTVDLRDLSTATLRALYNEAAVAGDTNMVIVIGSILVDRSAAVPITVHEAYKE